MFYFYFFLTGLLLYFFCFIFPTLWLKVESVRYHLDLNQSILQISDLHLERNRISASRLKKTILSLHPDTIVLTGDYIDTPTALPKLKTYLHAISETHIPCYAVLGNHDYYLDEHSLNELKTLFSTHNIRLLMNESVDLDNLQLIGIDDYTSGHSNLKSAFKTTSQFKKRIVITHNADVARVITTPYDYLMAGHLHGKQVAMPYLFKLKNMGFFASRGQYQGDFRYKGRVLYISKGIGQTKFNIRVGVRSEITLHHL